jgi:hypothetical protein
VPHFPANVTKAILYIGPTDDTLYRQEPPIFQSGGTWTEPAIGYSTGGAAPPATNTLAENVLVRFLEPNYRLRQITGVGYEGEAFFEEEFKAVSRVLYALGNIVPPAATMSGECEVPVQMVDGGDTIVVAAPTMDGVAFGYRPVPPQTAIVGNIGVAVPTLSGECTLTLAGEWHVAKTGSDSNPGTPGEPFLTIQHAIDTAAPSDTIVIQAGTYQENLILGKPNIVFRGVGYPIVDGDGGPYCLYSGGFNPDCEFYDIEFQNATRGIHTDSDESWIIDGCRFENLDRNAVRCANGTGHIVKDCRIVYVANNASASGIELHSCQQCAITGNSIQLCRLAAITDSAGTSNYFANNYINACGRAIYSVNGSADALIRKNYAEHLARTGVILLNVVGDADTYTRVEYNTIIGAAGWSFRVGATFPIGNFMRFTRNFWRQTSGHTFLWKDDATTGGAIIIDENMYRNQGVDTYAWVSNFQGGGSEFAASVAEIFSDFGYEENGSEYNAGTVANYGSQEGEFWRRGTTYQPFAATAVDASHNLSTATRTTEWTLTRLWDSGEGNNEDEWITYDLGSIRTWDIICFVPMEQGGSLTPQNIRVQSSASQTGPWNTELDTVIQSAGWPSYWRLSTPVTKRFIRFYIDDVHGGNSASFAEFEVGAMA